MIFNNNTTSLVDSIPMAEGYDGSCGAALALIESARNDYAMFRAMLDVDARELQIQRESAGYVTEGEITALAEATGSGILAKIKEIFKKLAEKIKAIFHTFISKIESLYKSDKQMVKKYGKEINRKGNIGNLEVKWIKYDNNYETKALNIKEYHMGTDCHEWKEESNERELYYAKQIGVSDIDSFESDLDDEYADGGEEDTYQIKDNEVGGMVSIMRFLDGYDKKLRDLNKKCNDLIKVSNRIVKEVDKDTGSVSKALINKDDHTFDSRGIGVQDSNDTKSGKIAVVDNNGKGTATEGLMKVYNHAYDMAVAYQNVVLKATRWVLDTNKKQYKQNKAAFMKAIAADNKKLEESAIYADAVAEAAAEEVESVISGALSKEELSKICNASLNVKDADVSDDPDKLTYGPDYYSDNLSYVRTDGSVDTEINSKSESAFFGQLLY